MHGKKGSKENANRSQKASNKICYLKISNLLSLFLSLYFGFQNLKKEEFGLFLSGHSDNIK